MSEGATVQKAIKTKSLERKSIIAETLAAHRDKSNVCILHKFNFKGRHEKSNANRQYFAKSNLIQYNTEMKIILGKPDGHVLAVCYVAFVVVLPCIALLCIALLCIALHA